MTTDGLDIFGVKPIAKAVEHASIRTIDGVAAFFSAICMPATEEFGLLLRDRVANFRQANLEKIAEKAREKIGQHGVEVTRDCSPRLIHEVIDQGSWADDTCIQDMWAGLIAVAAGTSSASDDSLIYTESLRRLTPFQARLLRHIYGDPRCCSLPAKAIADNSSYTPVNSLNYSGKDLLELYPDDLSKFVNISGVTHEKILDDECLHFLAIGRLRPQIDALVSMGLLRSAIILASEKTVVFLPTLEGLDLYMRCLGYKIYPLEAFVLTQQHWCRLKGIDSYTYGV